MTVEDLQGLPEIVAGLAAGPVVLHGLGRSMVPLIQPGDSVELVADTVPRRGAVYLAQLPDGRLVVHRLVGSRDGLLLLRGDANRSTDPPVDPGALHARAVRVIRGARSIRLGAPALRAYGALHVAITPRAEAAAKGVARARDAALSIATGPLRPLTSRITPVGGVSRFGAGDLERALVFWSGAGIGMGPEGVRILERALADGTGVLLGVTGSRGQLVAACEVGPFAIEGVDVPVTRLANMWVMRLYRRRGLARALVDEAVAWARERGLSELWLEVMVKNAEARALYESSGFHRIAGSSFVEARSGHSGRVALCRTL